MNNNNKADKYFKNPGAIEIPWNYNSEKIIDDVTQINKVLVKDVFIPKNIEELIDFVKNTDKSISIGGGRFSMGGQTVSHMSIHIDTRELNNVINYNIDEKTIRVEAGIRWCDIQKYIDNDDLSVKIMQTYANFTVGGSLSVNVHGRYIGLGPLILSVKSLKVLLADGKVVESNRKENSDIFKAIIGGYSFVGIILEAELELDTNVNVKRKKKKLQAREYLNYFKKNIRDNKKVIFHNADLYPPHYNTCNAISWIETDEKQTTNSRLQNVDRSHFLERYYFWVFSETKLGKFRREHFLDPLLFMGNKVHSRNYEAGYCVSELEPISRINTTYVLQEYFIPINKFDEFTKKMGDIYRRYNVNIINISVRHAFPDLESNMSWAREECFAFVVYHKQYTSQKEKNKVGIWHREIIEAAISVNGSYYLPYQPHATFEQFKKSYPNYESTFKLKKKLDKTGKIKNVLIDKYYNEYIGKKVEKNQYVNSFELNDKNNKSDFNKIFCDTTLSDKLYLFLQNIFNLYPEDDFFSIIKNSTKKYDTDEEVYNYIKGQLPKIKPFLADITHSLPALKKQKKVIIGQLKSLLNNKQKINGYLEIGTTGRHIKDIKKHYNISGKIYTINEVLPNNSPGDIFERGGILKVSKAFLLDNYSPITNNIKEQSLDLVFMPIGLHHIKKGELEIFIESLSKVIRKGGVFILRDHDAGSSYMKLYCSIIHTVFNLGLNTDFNENQEEYRNFRSVNYWINLLNRYGFKQEGEILLQDNDPSLNSMVKFIKIK